MYRKKNNSWTEVSTTELHSLGYCYFACNKKKKMKRKLKLKLKFLLFFVLKLFLLQMRLFSRKGAFGFSASSTAKEVTQGIDGTRLTSIVTGNTFIFFFYFSTFFYAVWVMMNVWVTMPSIEFFWNFTSFYYWKG